LEAQQDALKQDLARPWWLNPSRLRLPPHRLAGAASAESCTRKTIFDAIEAHRACIVARGAAIADNLTGSRLLALSTALPAARLAELLGDSGSNQLFREWDVSRGPNRPSPWSGGSPM